MVHVITTILKLCNCFWIFLTKVKLYMYDFISDCESGFVNDYDFGFVNGYEYGFMNDYESDCDCDYYNLIAEYARNFR